MTTKIKIISGFTIMIVLLIGIAVLGYVGMQTASNNFLEYRRMARFNVAASDMERMLNQSLARSWEFINSYDENLMAQSIAVVDEFIATAEATKSETSTDEELKSLGQLQDNMRQAKVVLATVQESVLNLRNQYTTVVAPNGMALANSLNEIVAINTRINNVYGLDAAAEAWGHYGLVLSVLSRFAESFDLQDAQMVEDRMTPLVASLDRLQRVLQTDEGRAIYARVDSSYQAVRTAFDEMVENARLVEANLNAMRGAAGEISAAINVFNVNVDAQMRAFGAETLDSNRNTQATMLGTSAVGIILGAALAIFIIIGLVRVLTRVSSFAGAVSEGDFSYDPQVREKGEIGAMVTSMKNIPATLQHIVEKSGDLANRIACGRIDDEFTVANYKGEFQTLTGAVNSIIAALRDIINALPVGVLTLGQDKKVLFLNKTALAFNVTQVGESYDDKCTTTTLKSGDMCNDEVSLDLDGKNHYFTLVTAPLRDLENTLVGAMEIISEVTTIKEQEILMRKVAEEATEISDRVAAASEELSAQVEQVSRGADMQREQMQSTASAMTEMNSTVLEVARNASQASEQGELTRNNAVSGAELVNQVVQAIQDVYEISSKMQSNMEELGKQADSIGGVISVITDIADQTNLLALNAAIEAARAGEAGRGFAVVADSVRNLAEATMKATQEVGSSITSIQNATRVNIGDMEIAAERVQKATELANSSGEALEQIVGLVGETSELVASIATAAEEQSSTSEEITRSVDQVNIIVGETAEGMVQSSAAVQDLSRMAQDLRRVMEGLR